MPPLLDQLLLPQRLITKAMDDLHRVAEAVGSLGALARELRPTIEPINNWMSDTAGSLRSLTDQAAGIRAAIEPMSEDVRILRDEFGRANDEIARLREAFGPELEALRGSAAGLHQELRQLRQDVRALAREADEISDVVEPLQSATERVGRVAERLPGSGRKD